MVGVCQRKKLLVPEKRTYDVVADGLRALAQQWAQPLPVVSSIRNFATKFETGSVFTH